MHIKDKAGLTQRLWSQAHQWTNVQRLEYRVDANPVAVLHQVGEVHRLAVDQDQINLGVGHAQGFDHILDGGTQLKGVGEGTLSPVCGQEIIQFSIEAKARLLHRS